MRSRLVGGPSGARRTRGGFSMVEMLVTLVIMLFLAVLVTPSIVGARDTERVLSSARWLEDITSAIHDPDSLRGSFRADIKTYPGALEHLTREIDETQPNICGSTYSPGEVIPDKWQGPYLNRVVNSSGFPIGIGVVRNALTRDDDFRVRHSILRIHVDDVYIDDAMALDERVDLSDGRLSGTVRWGEEDPERFVTVDYLMHIAGC